MHNDEIYPYTNLPIFVSYLEQSFIGEGMLVAVDLDGTLCAEQENWWEYESAPPICAAIAYINSLFGNGDEIVIYTSRLEEDRDITEKWLQKNGVNYHRIVFGKLRADLYIDNNSMKIREDK